MIAAEYASAVAAQFPDGMDPNRLEDVAWTRAYLEAGTPAGAPILMSMGENWEGPSAALAAHLAAAPAHLAGYQFSLWGEPNLARALSDFVQNDYSLPLTADVAVASCWSGTRGALADISDVIGRARQGNRIVFASPGYDYGTVMCRHGLHPVDVPVLSAETGKVSYDALVDHLDNTVAAIVINAQHNPVAHQWPKPILRAIFGKCRAHAITPVFDDAHKAIVARGVEPTDALGLWLQENADLAHVQDWYLVRSLGKQLNTNGWGVGLIAGPTKALERLVLEVRPLREYCIQGPQQWAIAQHLNGPDQRADTDAFNTRIGINRDRLVHLLPDVAALRDQICTPFSWFPLPRGISRAQIMRKTGVLLGGLFPSPMGGQSDGQGIARMYLGLRTDVHAAALDRLKKVFGDV